MANTFTQIYIQFVFAVQNRTSLIQASWEDELYKYITGIIKNHKQKLIAINGVQNHVHIFIGYKPNQLIPNLLQDIKGLHQNGLIKKALYAENSVGKKDMPLFLIHILK